MKSVFISGTGTDVGKTFVSAFLLRIAEACDKKALYWKPIQCGSATFQGKLHQSGDAEVLQSSLLESAEVKNTIFLQEACSPHLAFELEDQSFELNILLDEWKSIQDSDYNFVIVEGAGGLMVPISVSYFMRDLARDLKLPIALVSQPLLGTLNHSLMSIESLHKESKLSGVLFSYDQDNQEWLESDNKKTLLELSPRPLQEIPSIPAWEEWKDWSNEDCKNFLSNSKILQEIIL